MSEEKKPQGESKSNPEEDREIVYYYSRERRLERASPAVRELNEGTRKTSFLKSMTGNRGNMMILLSIMIIAVMYVVGTRFAGNRASVLTLGNNAITLQIFEEEGVLFLSIEKTTPANTYSYTGVVDIAVSPALKTQSANGEANPPQTSAAEDIPILRHRIFFTLDTPETYLVSLPFTGDDNLSSSRSGGDVNRTAPRSGDDNLSISRSGGDEFIVMLQNEHETVASAVRNTGPRQD